MKQLFATLSELLQSGRPAVTVMVIGCTGATPRSPGATMLVAEGIPNLGTVGGGQAEYDAARRAKALLVLEGTPCFTESYQCLSAAELAHMSKESGGVVTLLFLRWDASRLPLVQTVLPALSANADASLLLHYHESGWHGELTTSSETFSVPGAFSLKLAEAGVCYLFGGGHVSQALVPLLAGVQFPCVVLDERPEFTAHAAFPTAETRCGVLPALAAAAHFGPGDSVIIMTRGHQGDYEVLCEALRSPVWYLGMVGSHRKTAATLRRLREDGFPEEALARIVSPIGLAIDAETPAEIAISIAAQLIACRASHRRGEPITGGSAL